MGAMYINNDTGEQVWATEYQETGLPQFVFANSQEAKDWLDKKEKEILSRPKVSL